jgi:hypothetical protein
MKNAVIVFVVFIIQASYAHACDPWIGSPPLLSDRMKSLLIGNKSVPVYQLNLNNEIGNAGLYFPWTNAKGGRGVAGQSLTINMLHGAKGWAEVAFTTKVHPSKFKIISKLINRRYHNSLKSLKIGDVYGIIEVRSQNNQKILSKKFEFSNGRNVIELCNFNKITANIGSIHIIPYSAKFSINEHLLLR